MEPPRAALGTRLLLLCGLSLLGAAARTDSHCPRSITCTLQRRHECTDPSVGCGPCLDSHVEGTDGKCVDRATLHRGKSSDPLPEQDIEYLASLLNKQAMEGATIPKQNELGGIANAVESSDMNRAGIVTTNPPPPTKGGVNSSKVTREKMSDALLLGLVVTCTVAGVTALVVAVICWCRLQKEMKLAAKTDYSSNKASGPPPYDRSSPVDKKLAQSAQMYHYQHQKQQMLSMEKTKDEPKLPDSNTTSDEENEDGDFTVYECPGLAPTGEMEVKNPLFDDSTLHHPNSKSQ